MLSIYIFSKEMICEVTKTPIPFRLYLLERQWSLEAFFFTALSRIVFHGLWPVSHLGWKQKSFSHPKDPALALNFCSADKACVVHTHMQTTPKKLHRLEACVWPFQIELVYWAALRSQSMWESPNTKKLVRVVSIQIDISEISYCMAVYHVFKVVLATTVSFVFFKVPS